MNEKANLVVRRRMKSLEVQDLGFTSTKVRAGATGLNEITPEEHVEEEKQTSGIRI